MIHLYAFVHGLRALPGADGLAVVSLGAVDAVVGRVDEPVEATSENAVAHARVVESLLECAEAVLPARLGPPFADVAALREATAPRLTELRRRLLRVRGCVEVAVRIQPAAADRTTGTSYLRDLARAGSAASAAHEVLCAHALAARLEQTGRLFRAAYLVRRRDADEFARRVDATADAALACSRPLAPYSFAEDPA